MLTSLSTEHNVHPHYRPDIDGLRALAILPVVAFHAFPKYAPGGFVGVDIFFVISGYLISLIIFKSLARGDFSFAEFYAHRIRRIFPSLIVVLVASYVIGWFVLLPDEIKLLGKHITAGAGFVQNIVLQYEAGYFDVTSELKPLLHLWSLSVEEQFYLIFPLFVWLLWRKGMSLLTGIVLIALISFMLSRKGVHTDAVKTFFWPHTRFWELMAGALLAYVQVFRACPDLLSHTMRWTLFNRVIFHSVPETSRQMAILRNLAAGFGLVLILASIATYHAKMPWPGSRAVAPVLGTVLLIAAGPQAWINRRLLAMKLMVWIGLISYPLYLWHWPLLSFMRIVEGGMPAREWRITAVAASFALAALTYWLIEKPIRYGARRGGWKNAALCVLLVVVGYVGYNTYHSNRLAFRLNDMNKAGLVDEYLHFKSNLKSHEAICKARYPFATKAWCVQNKDASPTIILVGDSHAGVLYPGLIDSLKLSSHDVVASFIDNGCLPFLDTLSYDRVTKEDDKLHCHDLINNSFGIAKSNSVRTILLVSRGPLYLSGKGFISPDGYYDEGHHERKLIYRPRVDLKDHAAIWEAAMRATLAELTTAGKRVVFVLDNPELGFDPKTCIDSRPLRLTQKVRTPCAVPRIAFEERNRDYRALVAKVLQNFPQVVLIDGARPFCDVEWCWAIKDGKILYYDDDHVSLEGARLIAHEIMPHLSPP